MIAGVLFGLEEQFYDTKVSNASSLAFSFTAPRPRPPHATFGPPALRLLYRCCSVSLDIIGKAIFNYDFGSVTKESPVIQSVYSVLKEAEHRSMTPAPYWQIPLANKV